GNAPTGPQRPRLEAQPFWKPRLVRERKGRMHRPAKRSVHAHPPVADLVPESLHHHRAVVGHRAGGRRLIVEVREQVLDRAVIKSGALAEALLRGTWFERAKLADHRPQRQPELRWPARGVGLPEGDLARLAGRGGDEDLRRRDLGDPPRRCAEYEGLADAALVNHLL